MNEPLGIFYINLFNILGNNNIILIISCINIITFMCLPMEIFSTVKKYPGGEKKNRNPHRMCNGFNGDFLLSKVLSLEIMTLFSLLNCLVFFIDLL